MGREPGVDAGRLALHPPDPDSLLEDRQELNEALRRREEAARRYRDY